MSLTKNRKRYATEPVVVRRFEIIAQKPVLVNKILAGPSAECEEARTLPWGILGIQKKAGGD